MCFEPRKVSTGCNCRFRSPAGETLLNRVPKSARPEKREGKEKERKREGKRKERKGTEVLRNTPEIKFWLQLCQKLLVDASGRSRQVYNVYSGAYMNICAIQGQVWNFGK